MEGYHFLREDRKMQFPPHELVEVGKTYICEGELVLCQNGLHASKHIIDALLYAPGSIVCWVELSGDIVYGDDKVVARKRKVLWMLDATNILHEFACRCAEDALALVSNPDPRSVAAIKAKRDWLAGKITDKELAAAAAAAARAAARTAARTAAGAAARTAARTAAGAAGWNAAWDAAAAAWDATGAEAWTAARTAARTAAGAAAAAAWDATGAEAWTAARTAAGAAAGAAGWNAAWDAAAAAAWDATGAEAGAADWNAGWNAAWDAAAAARTAARTVVWDAAAAAGNAAREKLNRRLTQMIARARKS
jgi:hypothetical protein